MPVMVFTSYDCAELFVNGVSQGMRRKERPSQPTLGGQDEALEGRYRLVWEDVPFVPGELKAVAYEGGRPVAVETVFTAGEPHHILLETTSTALQADGKDIAYITATVVDREGHPCPHDGRLLHFRVRGAGSFRAAANGDPTCLDLFHEPAMHAFSGKLSVLVQSGGKPGRLVLEVSAPGLRKGRISLPVRRQP